MIFLIVHKRGLETGIQVVPENLLASTDTYKLYLGTGMNTSITYLVRVPRSITQNGLVYAEERELKRLIKFSNVLEVARIKDQGDDGKRIHYDWLFPVFADGFVCDELGGRRVNVLKILDAELDSFIPLPKLMRDTRIDAKTGAWILGRFLKLQAFLDDRENDRRLDFNPEMVLLAPEIHRMVYVGWFDELLKAGKFEQGNADCSKKNINLMLRTIADWVELCDLDGEKEFTQWLYTAQNGYNNGLKAHEAFYDFLHGLWGSGYHPFTYKIDGIWKNIDNQ